MHEIVDLIRSIFSKISDDTTVTVGDYIEVAQPDVYERLTHWDRVYDVD